MLYPYPAFDEPLYEDESINSLKDAIDLFKETVNNESHWFKQSQVFIIFNKNDLFIEKMKIKSLKECFGEEYDEDEYFNECKTIDDKVEKNTKFIQNKFLQQLPSDNELHISFVTCAYESLQIQNVFDGILSMIIKKTQSPSNQVSSSTEVVVQKATGTVFLY